MGFWCFVLKELKVGLGRGPGRTCVAEYDLNTFKFKKLFEIIKNITQKRNARSQLPQCQVGNKVLNKLI